MRCSRNALAFARVDPSYNSAQANFDVRSIATKRELSLFGSHIGNIHVEIADWIRSKFLFLFGFFGKARYIMALKTAMQRRTRQMWNCFPQRIKAIVKRQLCKNPERHDRGLFEAGQTFGTDVSGPHGRIMGKSPLFPLLYRFGIDAISPGKIFDAFLTSLYFSTDFRSRSGASMS